MANDIYHCDGLCAWGRWVRRGDAGPCDEPPKHHASMLGFFDGVITSVHLDLCNAHLGELRNGPPQVEINEWSGDAT